LPSLAAAVRGLAAASIDVSSGKVTLSGETKVIGNFAITSNNDI
jgi:hypothetical protein